jgi:hypothetical protein
MENQTTIGSRPRSFVYSPLRNCYLPSEKMNRRKKLSPARDEIDATYEHHIAALARIGIRDYQLTPAEARRLAHEVMIAYAGSRFRPADMQTWLTAAMRSAAAHRRGRAKG